MNLDRMHGLSDFLGSLAGISTDDALAQATANASKPFGLWTVRAGSILIRGEATENHFYFDNSPPEWQALYNKEVVADDPLIVQARRRIEPFTRTELKADPDLPEPVRQAFAITHAHGWLDGFAIPIHGPGGYVALISFAGGEIDLDPTDRAILVAIAHGAHARALELYAQRHGPTHEPLSAREVQVMRLVASGRTDREIGQLLEIAETTAHFHVEQAKRKLNARSRSQAVGTLILEGLL
jgi:LuxR family quorum sensing-dependent transcriptional regulator